MKKYYLVLCLSMIITFQTLFAQDYKTLIDNCYSALAEDDSARFEEKCIKIYTAYIWELDSLNMAISEE